MYEGDNEVCTYKMVHSNCVCMKVDKCTCVCMHLYKLYYTLSVAVL